MGYNNYGSDVANRWCAVCLYDSSKAFIIRKLASYYASTDGIGAYANLATEAPNAKYLRYTTRTYGHGLDGCYLVFGNDRDFAPYSNICPIYANVGKNYLGLTDGTETKNGTTFTIANQLITVSNTPSSTSSFSIPLPLIDGVKQIFSITDALPNGIRIYGKRTVKASGTVNYPTYASGTQANKTYLFECDLYTYENTYLVLI